jgi:uncharacterized repeat protein (TIGR01451 family)
VITWTGAIPPQQDVTLAYSATLTPPLSDRMLVTNTAQVNNGYGSLFTLAACIRARQAELSASFVEIDPSLFYPGDVVTYTIYLHNSGGNNADVELIHSLPMELTYQPDSVSCGTGQCAYANGQIEWQGSLPPRTMIPVRFRAAVSADLALGTKIVSVVVLKDQTAQVEYSILAAFDVAHQIYLPAVRMEIWRYYLPWLGRGM